MCCIGTFGEYTVAAEASCIKIDDDIPLDKALDSYVSDVLAGAPDEQVSLSEATAEIPIISMEPAWSDDAGDAAGDAAGPAD